MANEPSEHDVSQYLAGQVHALTAFALAIAATHPDKNLLLSYFSRATESAMAQASATLVSDRFLEAIEDTSRKISAALKR